MINFHINGCAVVNPLLYNSLVALFKFLFSTNTQVYPFLSAYPISPTCRIRYSKKNIVILRESI